jgi:murein lipoprotein
MKLVKLSIVAFSTLLAVGCASTSDIDNLQKQINTLKTDVDGAKSASTEAASRAASAEAAANRAAATADEVNTKLDRMFKHSMMK